MKRPIDGSLPGERALDDCYAINAAKTEIREGYNTGNIARILAQLAPDYTDLSDNFPTCAREEAHSVLHARLTVIFAENCVEFIPITANINLLGDFALVYGWHRLTLKPRDGALPVQRRMRFMESWQRLRGEWKLGSFMDNADPSPALASDTVASLLSGSLSPITGARLHH